MAIDMDSLEIEIIASSEDAEKKVNGLAKSLGALKSAGRGLSSVAKGFGSIASGASKVARSMASLKTARSAISSMVNPFGKLSGSIKNAVTSVDRLGSAFKRILFYRTIRTLIKQIGDAFKEGFNNLYYYSQGIGGQFAASMNEISTSMQYFKNSVGAAAAPLVNILAPAIAYVVDWAVTLLNVINQLLSVLSGAGTWTKAVKVVKDYGAAVGGAGSAAKEAMKYLAPFDELNVLPDNSSGGGGGGGAGGGYADMFEEAALDSAISDFVNSVKSAIAAGDWYGAGVLIGEKLNSLIPPDEWFAEWGQKIGTGIQHALDISLGFLRTFDFEGIGRKVAVFFNNLFDNVNPEDVGAFLASKIRIAIDLAYGFVTEFKWEDFGTWLSGIVNGWFNEIDWDKLAVTISEGVKGALRAAVAFLQNTDWKKVGADLGTFLSGIEWGDIFSGLWDALKEAAKAFGDFFDGLSIDLGGIARLVEVVAIAFGGWKLATGVSGGISKITGLFGLGKTAGKASGSGVPNVKTVLKGLADIALVIGGTAAIVTAIGTVTKIPGFNEAVTSGVSAIQEVFRGIASVGLEIAGTAAVMVILGKFGVATIAKGLADMALIVDGVPAVLVSLGALMSIPYFKQFLGTGIDSMKRAFNGIADVAIPLAGTAAAIVALGFASPVTVLSGVAGFALIVDGLSVALVSLGALNQIPGFSWLVGEGGAALAKLGEIIGDFAGSIVKGLLTTVSDSFPEIAQNLSDFATNLQPFVSAMSGIDEGVASATGILAKAILELTGASFLDSITSWLTGGKSLKDFGSQLVTFGNQFAVYAGYVSGIDPAVVTASANAAQSLVELSKELPGTGGILQAFIGEKDMAAFGKQLREFGIGLSNYSTVVKGVDGAVVTASADAASALVELAKDIPNNGNSLFGFLFGSKDMGEFGKQLYSFGVNFSNYANVVKNIDAGVVTASVAAAESVVALAKDIPTSGGLIGMLFGDSGMGNFGENLKSFGESFKEYYNSVSGIQASNLSDTTSAISQLIDVAGKAADVDNGKLKSFGSAIKDFGDKLSGTAWQTVGSDFSSGMSTMLSSLNSTISDMETAMSGVESNLSTTWGNIATNATAKFEEVRKNIDSKNSEIQKNVSTKWNDIKKSVNTYWTGINADASKAWGITIKNTLVQKWDAIISSKTQKFNQLKNDIAKVWDDINTTAAAKWESIKTTIVGKFGGIKTSLQTEWSSLCKWWSGLSLPAFNVKLPHFNMYGSFDPKTNKVPNVSVSWYAKGGIVDRATLFGAGEAGKEAIIPLERNTGWISEVADKLYQRMGDSGTANDRMAETVGRRVYEAIREAFMDSNNGSDDRAVNIYLDGKEIATTTTRYQRQFARAGAALGGA